MNSGEAIPEVLYKYAPPAAIDYFGRTQTLKFSNVGLLNDVDECVWDYADKAKVFAQRHESALLADYKENNKAQKLFPTESGYLEAHGLGRNSNVFLSRFNALSQERFLSQIGVLSLTASPTNSLMWAHYAQSSTGVCIGLSTKAGVIRNSTFGTVKGPVPVKYSNSRCRFEGNSGDENLAKMVLTKGRHWKYEEEYRCCRKMPNDHGFSFIPFRCEDVVKIILGIKMSTDVISAWVQIQRTRFPKASLWLATPSAKAYDMQLFPVPHPRLLEVIDDESLTMNSFDFK